MRKLVSILFAMLAVGARGAIYLNAASTAETPDGSCWSKAYKTLGDALDNMDEDCTVRVAQGYYSSQTMTVHSYAKVLIYGGYKGETDGDMTRDVEEHQTIIGGPSTAPVNIYWKHYVPVSGGFTYTTETTAEPIIVDGKLNLPAPTGEFDAYLPASGCASYAFQVPVGGEITADGIKFIMFARQGTPGGSAIGVYKDAIKAIINNCVFAGGTGLQRAMLFIGLTTETSYVTNCKFYYNGAEYSENPHVVGSASVEFDNCEFVGAVMTGTAPRSGAFAGCKSVSDALFTHNIMAKAGVAGTSPMIVIDSGTMTGCVISNNFCALKKDDTHCVSSLLKVSSGGLVEKSLIAGNRSEFSVLDGFSYAMIGWHNLTSLGGPYTSVYDGLLIVSNTVAVGELVATAGTYAIGILGSSTTSRIVKDYVYNCTFRGNRVEWTAAEGVTPTLCSGIVASRIGGTCAHYITNCTFKAGYQADVVDLAQYGHTGSQPVGVANSIFMSDNTDVHRNAFSADQPAIMSISHCTVKNLLPNDYPEEIVVTNGLYYDEIKFERVPFVFQGADTGYAYLRPAVRTPGIRDSIDDVLACDALGVARPGTGSTRGAIQSLAAVAENGVTLTIRRSPLTGGTVDIPVQSVASNAAIAPVTATGLDGATLSGWYEEGEETAFSTNNPLVIASLCGDLILTAAFSTHLVNITFDLGNAGTFDANSQTSISLSCSMGDTFPAIPAYTPADGRSIYAWDAMPAVVPSESSTYAAYSVSKDLRIVHVTPDGAGAMDGTSWANAYSNVAAAYADAGRYRGEVWLAQGVYTLRLPVTLLANVAVRGGFSGSETTAASADPVAYPVALSGANGGDYTYYAFSGESDAVTNATFTGVSFRDFFRSAIKAGGSGAGIEIARCSFERCNLERTSNFSTIDILDGTLDLSDSIFTNCQRGVVISSPAGAHNVFSDIGFHSVTGGTVRLTATGSATNTFSRCTFINNQAGSENTLKNASPGILLSGDFAAVLNVSDCVFDRCEIIDLEYGMVAALCNGSSGARINVSRCKFTNGRYTPQRTNSQGVYTASYNSLGAYSGGKNQRWLIRDSYFANNTMEYRAGNNQGVASALMTAGSGSVTLLNCTIENNAVSATVSSAAYAGTVVGLSSYAKIGIVNTLLDNNSVSTVGEDHGADVLTIGATISDALQLYNSVLFSELENYAPLRSESVSYVKVGECAITGYDAGESWATNIIAVGAISAEAPRLRRSAETGANDAVARGIMTSSPFGRSGRGVWLASSGIVYVYDADGPDSLKWLDVASRGGLSASSAPDYGLSLAAPVVPDAFDQPRVTGRIAYGPLNVHRAGTVFMLR